MANAARPERWIFMIDANATAEDTKEFSTRLEKLGADMGVKTVDSFPGTLLVQCDETFVARAKKTFGDTLRSVSRETFMKRPDTRIKINKPPRF